MVFYSVGVEYGIYCLLFFVDEKGDSCEFSVCIFVELQGVLLELLVKVFICLVKVGLVVVIEGVCGGFCLVWLVNEISVFDVVCVIDGDKLIFECCEVCECCVIFEGNLFFWVICNICLIYVVMFIVQKCMEEVLVQQIIFDLVCWVGCIVLLEFGEEVLCWMDVSWEGCGGFCDQFLVYMEWCCKFVLWKILLLIVVLIVLVFFFILLLEVVVEWLLVYCNGL